MLVNIDGLERIHQFLLLKQLYLQILRVIQVCFNGVINIPKLFRITPLKRRCKSILLIKLVQIPVYIRFQIDSIVILLNLLIEFLQFLRKLRSVLVLLIGDLFRKGDCLLYLIPTNFLKLILPLLHSPNNTVLQPTRLPHLFITFRRLRWHFTHLTTLIINRLHLIAHTIDICTLR